jgi:hypothetical protein
MAEVTLEKVLADAKSLSPDDQRRLIRLLIASERPEAPRKKLERLIAEQGKGPVDFDELLKLGEFFPEDESVDDLVQAVREWRRDRSSRSIE